MTDTAIAPHIVRPTFAERLETWLPVLLVPAIYTLGFFLASVALYYRYLYPSTLLVQVLAAGSACAWLSRSNADVRRGA